MVRLTNHFRVIFIPVKKKKMVYSSLIKSHRWSWLDLHFGQRGEEHGPSLQIHGAQNIRLPVYNACLSG